MRVIRIENLRPGHFVGRSLLDEKGRILLNAGVKLTEEYIHALRRRGYTRLYIREEEIPIDVQPYEAIDPVTRIKAMGALAKACEAIANEVRQCRAGTIEDIKAVCASDTMRALTGKTGPLQGIHEYVSQILNEVLTGPMVAGMNFIKSEDTEMYEHSIDVCLLAVLMGRAIGLPSHRMRQLATGCLLHDVGRMFVKPGVDVAVRIRQHTELGYEMLKNSDIADILAPHVALEHHEHQDGTGLPRGLSGSNTIERNRALPPPVPTLIGEIATVANAYDDLLRGKGAYAPVRADQAVARIRDGAGTWFNREVVSVFLKLVPVYPEGTEVVIHGGEFNGFAGIVIEVRPDALDSPVVVVFRDRKGVIIQPIKIDLRQMSGVSLRARTPRTEN